MRFWLLLFSLSIPQFSQSATGELRVAVTDQGGLPVQGVVDLISEANAVRQHLETDAQGVLVATRLPFGTYQVIVTRDGFAPFSGLIEIRTALPTPLRVTLAVAALRTEVTVAAEDTLLDLHRTSTLNRIGADALQQRFTALPGRSLPELVNTQPGWLLEANGVLHPRGSEYQTQYVIDGLPLTDNRSASFAPELEADAVQSMSILTAGYPAEYGRKLGGVIEVATAGNARRGWHGNLAASGGSFGTWSGYGLAQYGWDRGTLGLSGHRAGTRRYLDPPVEENFTNNGATSNIAVTAERALSDADRIGLIVRHGRSAFSVPNERVQQEAGQLQRRSSRETIAQFSYQHIFSSTVLGDVRGLTRDLSADLTSNAQATPIEAAQDRGVRETYVKAAVSVHAGRHEWKFGGDANFGAVRERFAYRITDFGPFDPATPPAFDFSDRRPSREQALFVQDQMRLGAWSINAGLRWDHYRLVIAERAWSPRLGLAWSLPRADLVIRASYDRAFQTPAFENLLLASSDAVDALQPNLVRLPVRPSRGNFYEAGFSKRLFGRTRIDVTHFRRDEDNFADDDVLLNTGVGFPIAFRKARIVGTEIKFELPRWRDISGFVSYGNMKGVGYLPITGGLLLGEDVDQSLESTDSFPVTQDQRHSLRGRVTWQVSPRMSLALAYAYGSGLPVEFAGDAELAVEQYGRRLIDRVDFDRGRVRPNASIDVSAAVELIKRKAAGLRLQADVVNLTNRLNLINFAGIFSGTAVAPPRSAAVRLTAEF